MSGAIDEGYVLKPGEGRLIDLGASSIWVKATEERTDGLFTRLGLDGLLGFVKAPGSPGQPSRRPGVRRPGRRGKSSGTSGLAGDVTAKRRSC